jgi:anti-sigma factor RsiW
MRCGRARRLISAGIDGELRAAEAEDFERHVAACPACAQELASIRSAMERLHELGDIEPGHAFVDGVMARVASEKRARRRLRVGSRAADFVESVFRRPVYQLAVLALVALLVAFEVAAWAAGTILTRPAVDPLSDDPHSAVTMQLKKIKKQSMVMISSRGLQAPVFVTFPEDAEQVLSG